MIINRMDVSENFRKFYSAFEDIMIKKNAVDSMDLNTLYINMATTCFERSLGEHYGDLIEYFASSVTIDGNVEDGGDIYMEIYENSLLIEELFLMFKNSSNCIFRGDGYEANIELTLDYDESGRVEIIFNTQNSLYNIPFFSGVENGEITKVLELETEALVFKNLFSDYLSKHLSHHSKKPHNNEYFAYFIGTLELLLLYTEHIPNAQTEIQDSLRMLFIDCSDDLYDEDEDLLETFFRDNMTFNDNLIKYLYSKGIKDHYLTKWGLVGDKVFVGFGIS